MGTDRCVGARLRSLRSLRPVPTRGPVVLTRTSAPLRIVKKACSVRLPLTPSITGQAGSFSRRYLGSCPANTFRIVRRVCPVSRASWANAFLVNPMCGSDQFVLVHPYQSSPSHSRACSSSSRFRGGYQGWVPFPRSEPRLVGPFYVIEIRLNSSIARRALRYSEKCMRP